MWRYILDTKVIFRPFNFEQYICSMCCEYARLFVCKRRTLVYSANATVCNHVKSLGLTLFVYELRQGTYMSDCCWYCLWTAPWWLNTSMISVKIGVWSSSSTHLFRNICIIHTLHVTALGCQCRVGKTKK